MNIFKKDEKTGLACGVNDFGELFFGNKGGLTMDRKFRLLVCCEESQRVCTTFRARGWEAYLEVKDE